MSPRKILTFTIAVFLILAILSFIFPSEGIKISDNYTINFIPFDEIINKQETHVKDISKILESTDIQEDTNEVSFEEKNINDFDSAIVDSQYVYYEPLQLKIDSVIRFLEFPNGKKTVLHSFFEELATIKGSNKLIRVMHYGDSQIETDRITRYLRNKLQLQFGGHGPGLVSAINAYEFELPMSQKSTGNWFRYTAFGRMDTSLNHNRFGVSANFARFSPQKDTVLQKFENQNILPAPASYKAGILFKSSHLAYKSARVYSRCRMFYGYNTQELKVKVSADGQAFAEEVLPASQGLKVKQWAFQASPTELEFQFEANDSPEFYGFAFDGYSGVAVDNIAMRGAAGLMFTRMNAQLMAEMFNQLNPKLIILQFGGNVVPGQKDNYDFYRRRFSNQIKKLKRVAPGVSILVIGPADMSKKENDKYITYPNVPLIRDALKQAAFEDDCPFWDMYEAMGGLNSMPGWVFNEPPLAEKDFTHFTPQGSKYVAQMFYNAFIYEYNAYLRMRKK